MGEYNRVMKAIKSEIETFLIENKVVFNLKILNGNFEETKSMTQEIFQLFSNLNFNWSVIESLAVLFSLLYVFKALKENIWLGNCFL